MSHPSGFDIAPGGATGMRLTKDVRQIERMEKDLIAKASEAMTKSGITSLVHGVFSIDDLEKKTANDLCRHIGVGVGYLRAEPLAQVTDPKAPSTSMPGGAVRTLSFSFMVILAVPTGEGCEEVYDATQVLTALRFGIMGSKVAGDETNRTWEFVRESPDIEASTDTMLYYSQVWRVAMQNVGTL